MLTDYSAAQSPLIVMQLSPDEARSALHSIETSRQAMRSIIRSHRGPSSALALGDNLGGDGHGAQFRGFEGVKQMPWLGLIGWVLSIAIGVTQVPKYEGSVDRRFIALLATIIGFAAVWPLVLGLPTDPRSLFAYSALVAMFCYAVAGIWFDVYLLWVGLIVAALILIGLFVFPAIFWWWIAIFGGGSLIGTGFYIRFFWR